jgi:hypothetical protein
MKNFEKFLDHSEIFFALQYIKNWTKVVPWKFFFLFLKKKFVSLKENTFEILWSEVWKVGFQFMLILGLLAHWSIQLWFVSYYYNHSLYHFMNSAIVALKSDIVTFYRC